MREEVPASIGNDSNLLFQKIRVAVFIQGMWVLICPVFNCRESVEFWGWSRKKIWLRSGSSMHNFYLNSTLTCLHEGKGEDIWSETRLVRLCCSAAIWEFCGSESSKAQQLSRVPKASRFYVSDPKASSFTSYAKQAAGIWLSLLLGTIFTKQLDMYKFECGTSGLLFQWLSACYEK